MMPSAAALMTFSIFMASKIKMGSPLETDWPSTILMEWMRPGMGALISLTLEAPEDPVWVEGDATRLAQVLDNLLTNAIKFTYAGGRVTVTLTPDLAARRAVTDPSDANPGSHDHPLR